MNEFVFQIPLEVNVCFRVVLMISSQIWSQLCAFGYVTFKTFLMVIMYSCPYDL